MDGFSEVLPMNLKWYIKHIAFYKLKSICVSQILVLKSNPQPDGSWRRILRKWVGQQGEALINEMSVLIDEPQRASACFRHVGAQRADRQPSMNAAGALISDFPVSGTVRSKWSLFQPLGLWLQRPRHTEIMLDSVTPAFHHSVHDNDFLMSLDFFPTFMAQSFRTANHKSFYWWIWEKRPPIVSHLHWSTFSFL